MNIAEIERSTCTGCSLCAALCPKSAIAMSADAEGFLYPKCNTDLCTNCGICFKECPSRKEIPKEDGQQVYEAKAKDDSLRKDSTSGGIFGLLAQIVLEKNGCVYGAGFEDGTCHVVHRRAESIEELQPLHDSKYVQSRIDQVFVPLQRDLEAGKMVLFSGTPCQVHAVKRFAERKKLADNLLLCDIVCHGCPSPAVYEKHLAYLEKKNHISIASVKFRAKEYGWSKDCKRILKLTATNGKVIQDTSYYQLYFRNNLLSRPVCERCRYSIPDRVSDITLGDFWGHKRLENDELGISLVMTNTEKGRHALEDIRDLAFLAESDLDIASRENVRLKQPPKFGPWRKPFWAAYHHLGYARALKLFTGKQLFSSVIRRIVIRLWK